MNGICDNYSRHRFRFLFFSMVKSFCMELKEIIEFIKKYIKQIILGSIIFGMVGALLHFVLPTKHYASGSLFIRRSVNPFTEDHFTYEGYYGQQSAMLYTNSIIGLVESEDIRKQALENLNVEVNEKTLRKYSRKIKTRKTGPQLLTLITKDPTPEKATLLWKSVSDSTINTLNKINKNGDPFISVAKVSDEPIVKESYKNIFVDILVGLGIGFIISTTFFSLKSYLSYKK